MKKLSTKEIMSVKEFVYLIQNHADLHKLGDVHSVLRISSAHNKGGPPHINMAQILHLSNFFELN